eukprot:724448-Karenia_brevis.AAC.1
MLDLPTTRKCSAFLTPTLLHRLLRSIDNHIIHDLMQVPFCAALATAACRYSAKGRWRWSP